MGKPHTWVLREAAPLPMTQPPLLSRASEPAQVRVRHRRDKEGEPGLSHHILIVTTQCVPSWLWAGASPRVFNTIAGHAAGALGMTPSSMQANCERSASSLLYLLAICQLPWPYLKGVFDDQGSAVGAYADLLTDAAQLLLAVGRVLRGTTVT
jgi:hypothetical protein